MGKVQSILDANVDYVNKHIEQPKNKGSKIFKLTKQESTHFKPSRSLSFVELPEIDLNQVIQYENIGWGATGVVKRCEYEGKEVAVKFLFPDFDIKKFRTELQNWCSIEHPNIVEVYAACTQEKKMCMVMEYMKEGSLKSYLHSKSTQRPTTWPLLYRIAIDISCGLRHLHEISGRIHRDIKSENILLNSFDAEGAAPVAKLCDFGDCKRQGNLMTPSVGTISYMAPEVFTGDYYTNKIDVYSFGILLWEMITRKEPFGEEMFIHEIADKVTRGVRPALPEYCPPSVCKLIQECWSQDPDDRPTFKEITDRLLSLGRLWDQMNVDQLLADVEYETTDTENHESNLWEETTFTDMELVVPPDVQLPDGSAEEEQELSYIETKPKPKLLQNVKLSFDEPNSPVASPRRISTPFNARKTKRVQHKTLPKNFRSTSARETTKKSNQSKKSEKLTKQNSPKHTNTSPKAGYGADDLEALREKQISKADGPIRVRSTRSATTDAKDQLRELSKARSNLHQLLAAEEQNEYTTEDSGLVIQVLRASLHRESERVHFFKDENELLAERLRVENQTNQTIRAAIAKISQRIEPQISIDTQPPVRYNDFSNEEGFDGELENQSDSGTHRTALKWCEIVFDTIYCEPTPYYYCSFAIWFKAEWKSFPVRLCMIIGSIYRELLTKFRKLSTVIQQITNHPNICDLLGIVSEAPNFGILLSVPADVIELKEIMELKPLTMKEKLEILRSIAMAVSHCHSHSRSVAWLNNRSVFVHPQTLETKIVHVCNLFYFSQRLDTQWEKFRWQAPEVFYGRNKSSARADCFSLGLLIWHLITEKEPYGSTFSPEIADKLSRGWRLPIPEECPPELKE